MDTLKAYEKVQQELLKPFWTEEELKRHNDAVDKLNYLTSIYDTTPEEQHHIISENAKDLFETCEENIKPPTEAELEDIHGILENLIPQLIDEQSNIRLQTRHNACSRYLESFKDNPEAIYTDIEKIIQAITKEDFKERVERYKSLLSELETLYKDTLQQEEHYILSIKWLGTESYKNAFLFCTGAIALQAEFACSCTGLNYGEDKRTADIIDAKVSQWYERPEGYDIYHTVTADIKKELEGIAPAEQLKKVNINSTPDTIVKTLTMLSERAFDPKIKPEDLNQVAFDISKHGTDIQIAVAVNIYPETTNLKGFDGSVHDEVCSFLFNGILIFTARQIATRLYYGDNPHNLRPSPQQVGAVTKSIETMRKTDAVINYTEHMEQYFGIKPNKDDPNEFILERYILPLDKPRVKVQGQRAKGYSFMKSDNGGIIEPPFYAYSRRVNQIGGISAKAKYIPNVSMTETNIIIRDFLLKEIMHMQNNTSWNRTITADRIIDISEKELSDRADTRRKQRKAITDDVQRMLQTWKDKTIIKDFQVNRKAKNTVYSFTITPYMNKEKLK